MIDSHAHLDHSAFDGDRENIIENLVADGVDYVFNIGSDLQSSRESIELAHKYEHIYAVVGVHPADVAELDDEMMAELEDLLAEDKVVAIGEIGLDYHYEDNPPREIQIAAFKRQLELASKHNMPVAIHSRDADEDTYEVLLAHCREDENFVALLHSYAGDVELMEKYVELGFYISLNGITTFKNGGRAKEVAAAVPLDRLLLETDCPYLSPEPYRGKRNEPKRVIDTAKYVAELRGMDFEELEAQIKDNTLEFYRVNGE